MIPENCAPGVQYKVAYLLHGLHANQAVWTNNSLLPLYGKKYDCIFVMPDVGRSFYFDQKYGRNYYTFISEELPQITGNIFNISARREDTAVIGYSMGGNGALKLALLKPQQYGFCGAISSACVYFKPALEAIRSNASNLNYGDAYESKEILKDLYNIYGVNLEYRMDNDIPNLIKNFSAENPKPVFYSACGIEDNLLQENRRLKDDMKSTSFDFTYEEWQGAHEWDFFNAALEKTLEFWYQKQIK
jgi:S-formylglutathione hydrolase FrmB